MPSSRSSGRGYRRRMKKKLAGTSKTSNWSKPPKISLVTRPVTRPERKFDCSESFVPTERDLELDEAVWDLYNRWCLHYKIHRTLEEMQLRFIYFKKSAISVFENNEKCKNNKSGCSQQLFRFSDRTDKEWKRKRNSKYIG